MEAHTENKLQNPGENAGDNSGRDRPTTKREQRAASIDALLTKALTLFITQGYHATTVEEIAQAADLTKGAVYFYFKSKANVLKTLLDRTEELTVEPTLAAMQAAGADPRDRLNAFVRSQSVIGAEKTEYMLLAILMSAEFNGSGDEIENRLMELMARMEDALRETVKVGQASGVFRKGIGPNELASVIMATNKGCYVEWYMRGGDLKGHDFARAFRDFVFDGVAANEKSQ
jgi:AcrR family transcriptional regulator